MKEYITPVAEFIELDENVIATSTCDYQCPNAFGTTCTGNPYAGT